MYPPETSLIPVTVALTRFIESNGLASIFGWYPHWYLGIPYQYLTGPIVPLLQVIFHKIFPALSLFDMTYALLFLSFLASILGWGLLAKKISGKRFIGIVLGLLLVVLPWRLYSALALRETSTVIAENLLPYALIAFWLLYKKRGRKYVIYSILSLSTLFLISTSVFTIFIVGISGLILSSSYKNMRVKKVSVKVKSTLLVVLASIFVATLWYGFGYWVTVVGNPSIGGASGIKAFVRIFDLLRASLPLILAIVAVYFSGRIKSKLTVFSLVWVLTFLFLTLFRFIGDPDFWQDWTSWFSQLEIGLALLASKVIYDVKHKRFGKNIPKVYYVVLASLLLPFALINYVHGLLQKPQLISNTIPRGVASLEKLIDIAGDRRAFISGSTVFWANSLYDINQVRGGIDKAATHPYWDHAAFQLREGKSPELARAWLEALGVSYVLVHGPGSGEAYHDFRNVDKWQEVGEVTWTGNGDAIIEVSAPFAWVVDLVKMGKVESPESGADLVAINKYLSTKKRDAFFEETGNNSVIIETDKLSEGEGIVVAIPKNSKWKSEDGKLSEDPMGNILLTPNDYTLTNYTLRYR